MMQQESTKTLIIATMLCVLAPGAVATTAQAAPSGWEDLARGFGGPRDGDIIVEQLPTRLGGLGADTAFRDYIGRPTWQQIADDILLDQAAMARHISWHGFYGGYLQDHDPPTGDETMRVRFYAARPGDGLPGDVLYEESFLNPSRIATGFNVVADVLAPEYFYEADLASPMALAAGTPYWLEIVQVGDLESHFRWEAGYAQSGHATSQASMPEWQYVPTTSMAFQLSIVPEPAAAVLLGLAIVLAVAPRNRKEGRHVRTLPPMSPNPVAIVVACALALGALASTALAEPNDWGDLARSFGGPRDGDVIVEQLPTRLGGPGSDTLFRYVHGEIVWQQVADNILLAAPGIARRISWHGFYGGWEQSHEPPVGDETMRIRFYAARPGDGLPGDVLYEESLLNPSRTATGFNVVSDVLAPEYFYEVDLVLPVSLAAATPYWLEIVQVGDLESTFRWEAGYGVQPGFAYLNDAIPDWRSTSGSLAFELSSIPEPSGLLLVAMAFGLTARCGARKEVCRE